MFNLLRESLTRGSGGAAASGSQGSGTSTRTQQGRSPPRGPFSVSSSNADRRSFLGEPSRDAKEESEKQERFELLRELKASIQGIVGLVSLELKGDPDGVDQRELHENDVQVEEVMIWLERCLWHGLRQRIAVRSGDGSVRAVHITFWNVVRQLVNLLPQNGSQLEKSVLESLNQVQDLQCVKSELGKSRAWIRIALNKRVLDAALNKIFTKAAIVQRYYEIGALMRCEESRSIFLSMIAGLNGLVFKLDVDVDAFQNSNEPIRRLIMVSPKQGLNRAQGVGRGKLKPKSSDGETWSGLFDRASKALVGAPSQSSVGSPSAIRLSIFGSSLTRLVHDPSTCAIALQEWRIGVPDELVRCFALLWTSPHLYSTDVFSRRPSAEVGRKFQNAGVSLRDPSNQGAEAVVQKRALELQRALASMSGNGLTLYSRVGVDVQMDIVCASVSAATSTGIGASWHDRWGELTDAFTVASLVKFVLRQLSEPLIPFELYDAFIACHAIPSREDRVRNLTCLVDTIPQEHKPTLDMLLLLCDRACNPPHGQIDQKADALSLASSLAPTILRPRIGKDEVLSPSSLGKYNEAIEVFALLIENQVVVMENVRTYLVELRTRLAEKNTRLREIADGLSRPLDPVSNTGLDGLLKQLWEALTPTPRNFDSKSEIEEDYESGEDNGGGETTSTNADREMDEDDHFRFGLVSRGWLLRGFRNENALSEFRGGGITAVKDLAYFVKRHGTKAKQMVARSSNTYPFVLAATQVSRMVAGLLGLTGQEFDDSIQQRDKLAAQPWWHMLDDPDATHRVFCMAFLLLDCNFAETNASTMDLDRCKHETKQQMAMLLARGPKSVDELWRSWIDLRASTCAMQQARISGERVQKHASEATLSDPGDIDENEAQEPEPNVLHQVARPPESPNSFSNMRGANEQPPVTPTGIGLRRNENTRQAVMTPAQRSSNVGEYLPRLLSASNILTTLHITKLEAALASEYQGYDWSLVFSNELHGSNLSKLFQLAGRHQVTILVVKDVQGVVFGGFNTTPWKINPNGYYGTGQSFIFTFHPTFKAFRWTKKNEHFMFANEDSIAMGGGGEGFSLYLDQDLKGGTSHESDTFGNPCLAGSSDFDASFLEIWTLTMKS